MFGEFKTLVNYIYHNFEVAHEFADAGQQVWHSVTIEDPLEVPRCRSPLLCQVAGKANPSLCQLDPKKIAGQIDIKKHQNTSSKKAMLATFTELIAFDPWFDHFMLIPHGTSLNVSEAWQIPGLELGLRVSNCAFASREVRWEDKDRSEKGGPMWSRGGLSPHYKLGLSENSVPLHPMVLLIIIPTKWL